MNEAGPYLLSTSLWGWGEPLLHPELPEILRLQQGRGIVTFLSTNGQNLDDERILKALIDYPPTYLIVALDGITNQTNSKFRVGARLEPALEGVQSLARMKRKKTRLIHTAPPLHRHETQRARAQRAARFFRPQPF